jgi:NTE family protein
MDASTRLTFAQIADTPLGQALGPAHGDALAQHLAPRALAAGDTLFRQGEPADSLYLVLQGRLRAVITGADGAVQSLGEIGPGELVGEVALLRGTPRLASVEAQEPSLLAALDAAAWQDLRVGIPSLESMVRRAAEWRERTSDVRQFRPDAAWVRAWLGRTELLAGAEPGALAALERELMWETLPGGDVLLREGDAGECMWFVVSGRLRASVRRPSGAGLVVGEIAAGECVGEMALLSGAPRATTVKAVRDTELLRLPKSAFDRLVRAHPEAMLRLSRAIVGRLQRTLAGRPAQPPDRAIALVAAAPDVPLASFAEALATEFSTLTRTVVLDGTPARRDVASSAASPPEVVVLVCDTSLTPWTARCLRQADDVVVVASAGGEVRPAALEQQAVAAASRREATRHLVLLHQAGRAPSGTEAWLAARPGVHHNHVRVGVAADHARLARRLSGRAIGLALSGGGARGFAHLGVLRALHEAGLPIDLVAGTSMGATIGAVLALGYTPEVAFERCHAWVRERPWTDITLPVASIVRGRRVRRALSHLLGAGRIEDLWLPYACVTSNLTSATVDVHTEGPLSLLVLASNSVPGLAPPVCYNGQVHVDGGVMDNLPVQALRAMGAGRVIAVDIGTELRVPVPPRPFDNPSGWSLLWDGLRGRPSRAVPVHVTITRAFTLASDDRAHAACRDADLVLRPPLGDYTSSDFEDIAPIAEIGYEHAAERLAEWVARGAVAAVREPDEPERGARAAGGAHPGRAPRA